MTWDLAVNGKSVGIQIGTNLGFYEMAQYCTQKGGKECRAFFTKGWSKYPQALRTELLAILANNKVDPDIAECIKALVDGLCRHDGNFRRSAPFRIVNAEESPDGTSKRRVQKSSSE
jgi:hypothetical protein